MNEQVCDVTGVSSAAEAFLDTAKKLLNLIDDAVASADNVGAHADAQHLLMVAHMQNIDLKLALAQLNPDDLLFSDGSFVQADNHNEVIQSSHFKKAMIELTRRRAHSKRECATLIAEQAIEREKDGPKAAAFDWLMDKIQEAYDLSGWLEFGDMIVTAHSTWGRRDECCVKAEIQWKDRRDEPLDLLSAIEQAKKTGGES